MGEASGASESLIVRFQGDTPVPLLEVDGEIDMGTAGSLNDALEEFAMRASGDVLLVDLRNVRFMDSTGLHSLLRAERACREKGRRLVLVRGPHSIQRVFEVSGTHSVFRFVIDPAEVSAGESSVMGSPFSQ